MLTLQYEIDDRIAHTSIEEIRLLPVESVVKWGVYKYNK